MGLFSSPTSKTPPLSTVLSRASDVQQNLLGHYIAVLNANRDTRAIVADIKRANDAAQLSGVSSVRFQRFLLDHIEERVIPKDRPRVRAQILRDFPTDARGRAQVEHYGEELAEVQLERDRYRHRLAQADKARQQEVEARRRLESELSGSRRESKAIIDHMGEELSMAQHRGAIAEDKIAAGLIALAQLPDSPALLQPRPRTTSQYHRPSSMSFRPPSLSLEPRSTSPSNRSATTMSPRESAGGALT